MQENLAIASVPMQEWGALYGAEEALRVGTIFQDLNKPFFAADSGKQGVGSGQQKDGGNRMDSGNREPGSEQQQREQMMAKIQETSFALDDVRLYMDTHPDDRQGLAFFKETLAKRKTLLSAYAQQFYPLTVDCSADRYEKDPASECYCWLKGPMPWEGACV